MHKAIRNLTALLAAVIIPMLLATPPAKAQDFVEVLDHDAAGVSVSNSTAETEIYGYTVAAYTIGDVYRGVIHTRIFGFIQNSTGSSKNATIRLKFGGTTHYQDTALIISDGEARPFWLGFYIVKLDATDRFASVYVEFHQGNVSATPVTGFGKLSDGTEQHAAVAWGTELLEYLNVDNALSVTVQLSAASANYSFTASHGYTLLE